MKRSIQASICFVLISILVLGVFVSCSSGGDVTLPKGSPINLIGINNTQALAIFYNGSNSRAVNSQANLYQIDSYNFISEVNIEGNGIAWEPVSIRDINESYLSMIIRTTYKNTGFIKLVLLEKNDLSSAIDLTPLFPEFEIEQLNSIEEIKQAQRSIKYYNSNFYIIVRDTFYLINLEALEATPLTNPEYLYLHGSYFSYLINQKGDIITANSHVDGRSLYISIDGAPITRPIDTGAYWSDNLCDDFSDNSIINNEGKTYSIIGDNLVEWDFTKTSTTYSIAGQIPEDFKSLGGRFVGHTNINCSYPYVYMYKPQELKRRYFSIDHIIEMEWDYLESQPLFNVHELDPTISSMIVGTNSGIPHLWNSWNQYFITTAHVILFSSIDSETGVESLYSYDYKDNLLVKITDDDESLSKWYIEDGYVFYSVYETSTKVSTYQYNILTQESEFFKDSELLPVSLIRIIIN